MQFTDSSLYIIPPPAGCSIWLQHIQGCIQVPEAWKVQRRLLMRRWRSSAPYSSGITPRQPLVTVLFYLAEYLEEYAGERSERSVESLIRLRPAEARVIEDGAEGTRSIDEVRKGTLSL